MVRLFTGLRISVSSHEYDIVLNKTIVVPCFFCFGVRWSNIILEEYQWSNSYAASRQYNVLYTRTHTHTHISPGSDWQLRSAFDGHPPWTSGVLSAYSSSSVILSMVFWQGHLLRVSGRPPEPCRRINHTNTPENTLDQWTCRLILHKIKEYDDHVTMEAHSCHIRKKNTYHISVDFEIKKLNYDILCNNYENKKWIMI